MVRHSMTEAEDFLGNTLRAGDRVVYVSSPGGELRLGTVKKIEEVVEEEIEDCSWIEVSIASDRNRTVEREPTSLVKV